jgi:hypothetical protein
MPQMQDKFGVIVRLARHLGWLTWSNDAYLEGLIVANCAQSPRRY